MAKRKQTWERAARKRKAARRLKAAVRQETGETEPAPRDAEDAPAAGKRKAKKAAADE